MIADIPGLIEGASEGAGLGHDFLAHVERTRLLVHVLDLAPLRRVGPARRNYETIERELAAHDARLARAAARAGAVEGRPRAAGGGASAAAAEWRERLGDDVAGVRHLERDAAGARRAARRAAARACRCEPSRRRRRSAAEDERSPSTRCSGRRGARGFSVERGRTAGRSRQRRRGSSGCSRATTSRTRRRWRYVERRLRRIGVIRALEAAGFEPGDEVEIARRSSFELDPG